MAKLSNVANATGIGSGGIGLTLAEELPDLTDPNLVITPLNNMQIVAEQTAKQVPWLYDLMPVLIDTGKVTWIEGNIFVHGISVLTWGSASLMAASLGAIIWTQVSERRHRKRMECIARMQAEKEKSVNY